MKLTKAMIELENGCSLDVEASPVSREFSVTVAVVGGTSPQAFVLEGGEVTVDGSSCEMTWDAARQILLAAYGPVQKPNGRIGVVRVPNCPHNEVRDLADLLAQFAR